MQRHRRSSQEATVQPWEGPGLSQGVHLIMLFELVTELFPRKVEVLVTKSRPTLCDPVDCSPPGSPSTHFPNKNTGVGCHFLLQGIFPILGSNPGLPLCRQMLYHLNHQGSPQKVKNLPAMQETRAPSLSQEEPLQEEMATHSSILAWKILQTEEPGGLQSMERAGHS